MKKIFSLLLTVALLLSAVAFPAVVSAANEAIEVYFVCEKETIYPGDVITVKLMAKTDEATGVFSANYASVYFSYDTNVLALNETTAVSESPKGTVAYTYESADTALDITTAGTELADLTFTVADTPGDKTTLNISTSSSPATFAANDTTVEIVPTVTPLEIDFTANSAAIKYNNGTDYVALPQTGYTHTDASGISVKAEVEGNVDITIAGPTGFDGTDVDLVAGETLTEAGEYTITVTPVGGTVTTYVFTLSLYQVDAKLSIETPENTTGYAPNANISLPVAISGLGDAKASIVKFTLNYEKNYLTLVDNALHTLEGEAGAYTVIYNKDAVAANNKGNGTLTTLNFTVNSEIATYGTTPVSITAQDLALETTTVNATSTPITTSVGTAQLTVVPAEGTAYATLSGQKEAYTKDTYNITVAPVSGANVKYFASETAITDEINAEEKYGTATPVENNSIAISDMKYYYVVAAIGTNPVVYDYIDEIKGMCDNVAPVLPEITEETVWAQSRTINVTATATGAAITKYYYNIDNGTTFTEVTPGEEKTEITISETANKVFVKVEDAAGNISEVKGYTILVDATAPEAALTDGGRVEGGYKLTVAASDAHSGLATVQLLKDGEKVYDVVFDEGASSKDFVVTEAGTYRVSVSDNALNKAESNEVNVVITEATLKPVKVALYEDGTLSEGFVAGEVNNGTFMYVKLAKPVDEENYTTTYELNGEAVSFAEDTEYYEITPGENTVEYTLTVTTTNVKDTTDTKSETYKFSVASTVYDMKSVNDNAYFNAFDYANLVRVTTGLAEGTGANVSTDVAFNSGLLSADVNADMKITAADAAEVLQAMKAVKYVGIYNFNILNGIIDAEAELN